MIRKATTIMTAVLLAAVNCNLAVGQAPPPAILTIDLANYVEYQDDIGVPAKYATDSKPTKSAGFKNFGVATILADIVAVNGQPARGLFVGRTRAVGTSVNPSPGYAIADIERTALREQIFEISKSDGTPIGTIVGLGFSGGSVPPGSPSGPTGGNWAIVGGTGAFLGARGQEEGWGGTQFAHGHAASMAEDPVNRPTTGGGIFRYTLHVIPMTVPQIVTVIHSSDFTLVSPSKAAAGGEVLSLFATGLGPTIPGVGSGQPFPSSPVAAVNSPVGVTVNGKPAEVLSAAGFPGSTDGYQVNFRIPPDTAKGVATIQVSAAWIAGTAVTIAVQCSEAAASKGLQWRNNQRANDDSNCSND
jgi:hypothetical protein